MKYQDYYLVRTSDGFTEGTVIELYDDPPSWAITVQGIQWGLPDSPRDSAGCAGDHWASPGEAKRAFEDAHPHLNRGDLRLEERP